MHELISTFESSWPLTKAETTQLNLKQVKERREKEKEEKARKENTTKAELWIKSLVGKAKDLNKVVSDLKETESMTEQEVRENLLETKLWGKKLNDLEAAKEKVDQDLISIDVNNDLKTNLEDEFEDMLRVVKETRPEVSKLTPENKRNSQVTKLSPTESGCETNRLADIQKHCNIFKQVYKNQWNVSKILSKVAHLELKIIQS